MNKSYLRICIIAIFILIFVFLDIFYINKLNTNYDIKPEIAISSNEKIKQLKHNYKVLRKDGLNTMKIFLDFAIALIVIIFVALFISYFIEEKNKINKLSNDKQFLDLVKMFSSNNEMARISAIVSLTLLSKVKIKIENFNQIKSQDQIRQEFYKKNKYLAQTLDLIVYGLLKETQTKVQKLRKLSKVSQITDFNKADFYMKASQEQTLIEQACCESISKFTDMTLIKNINIGEKSIHLSAINLDDKIMEGVSLERINLEGASLKRINLMYSYLYNTVLCRINAEHAYIGGANLSLSDLTEANLANSFLSNSNLKDAYLCFANLYNANLDGANLKDADLASTNLTNASMFRANLYHVNNLPVSVSNVKTLEKSFIDEENYNSFDKDLKQKYIWKRLIDLNKKDFEVPVQFLTPITNSFLDLNLIADLQNKDYQTVYKELQRIPISEIYAPDAGIITLK